MEVRKEAEVPVKIFQTGALLRWTLNNSVKLQAWAEEHLMKRVQVMNGIQMKQGKRDAKAAWLVEEIYD
jgi:hypothetical protein